MLRFEGLPRLIVVMTEQELTRQIIALRDPMFRFARTLLLRRDEAEDAVADVVARLWSAPQRMIGCRDLRAFALTAVRNRCYDLLRQRQAGARRADALTGMRNRRQRIPSNGGKHANWYAQRWPSCRTGNAKLST